MTLLVDTKENENRGYQLLFRVETMEHFIAVTMMFLNWLEKKKEENIYKKQRKHINVVFFWKDKIIL